MFLITISDGKIESESREFNCCLGVTSFEEILDEGAGGAVLKLSCELVGLDGKRGEERTCEVLVEVEPVDGRRSVSIENGLDAPIEVLPDRGGIGGAVQMAREDSRSVGSPVC